MTAENWTAGRNVANRKECFSHRFLKIRLAKKRTLSRNSKCVLIFRVLESMNDNKFLWHYNLIWTYIFLRQEQFILAENMLTMVISYIPKRVIIYLESCQTWNWKLCVGLMLGFSIVSRGSTNYGFSEHVKFQRFY